MRLFIAIASIVGIAVGAFFGWQVVRVLNVPAWAILLTGVVCWVVFYLGKRIERAVARIQCELTGHWPPQFRRYSEVGYCLRCKGQIATRPIESDGPGMQSGEDTLHQRLSRLETALGIETS